MTLTAPAQETSSLASADIGGAAQRSATQVLGGLGVSDQHGLSDAEVIQRRE